LELVWHQIYEHTQQRKLATCLQYVDDLNLLLAVANHQDHLKGTEFLFCLMGIWLQGILKEDPDLSIPGQIFGASHLPRPTETWCRKKTSCLFNPNPNFKKTDP
jgi:hypothetical protein